MQILLGNDPIAKSKWSCISKVARGAQAAGPRTYVLKVLWKQVPALLVVIMNNLAHLLLMLTTSICLRVAVRLNNRLKHFLQVKSAMLTKGTKDIKRSLDLNFESVLELEGDFVSAGIKEGLKMGSYLGELQGIWSGIDYGFKIAAEGSFYKTFAEIWAGLIDDLPKTRSTASLERLESNLKNLETISCLLLTSCHKTPCDLDIEFELNRARCKHIVLVKFLDKFAKRVPSTLISASFLSQSDTADAFVY